MIYLTEYEPTFVPQSALSVEEGTRLWRHYAAQIEVVFPAPPSGNRWKLTSKGWVGHLPFSSTRHLVLRPRITPARWFDMLCYTPPYHALRPLKGQVYVETQDGLPAALLTLLTQQIQARLRQGLYWPYQAQTAALEFVRGRILWAQHLRTPWQPRVVCRYHRQTANVPDNQILAWTLNRVLQGGWCPPPLRSTTRSVLRALQSRGVDPVPFEAEACLHRTYHSLNSDYAAMHALCYFFLAHIGPRLEAGPRAMLPFLIHMPTVFEGFVAGWVHQHLPAPYTARAQVVVRINSRTRFRVDQVIYHPDGTPICVLDTKYKPSAQPTSEDIAQVVAYAVALGCTEAVLVYPHPIESTALQVGRVRVQALAFNLQQDIHEAGHRFLDRLLEAIQLRTC